MNTNHLEIKLSTSLIKNKTNIEIVNYLDILIDGKLPYIHGDIVDAENLKDAISSNKENYHFIFNCSCGIPECAGRFNGVKVININGFSIWEDLDYDKKWVFNLEVFYKKLKELKKNEIEQLSFFRSKNIDFYPVLIKN